MHKEIWEFGIKNLTVHEMTQPLQAPGCKTWPIIYIKDFDNYFYKLAY